MVITVRYRLNVLVRIIAAAAGGYALANLVGACLALALPTVHIEAALAGLMSTFVVYALAVMWMFAVKDLRRALGGLAVSLMITGALFAGLR